MSLDINLPLPEAQKLNVLYRIEPGCLGPDGANHVEEFCNYAEREVQPLDSDFVHWILSPRFDKDLPELQYRVNQRGLSHDQAERYLQVFGKELDEFESHLHTKLATLINDYMGH